MLTLNLANAQQTTPESLAEVKPEVVFQDGSTYDNDLRVWKTATGEFTVIAKLDSFLNAEVVRLIRKDTGKVVDVGISILAPDDQELLKKIRKTWLSRYCRTVRKRRLKTEF